MIELPCPTCGLVMKLDDDWYFCQPCWNYWPLFEDIIVYDEPEWLVNGPPELQWAETDIINEGRYRNV
jgi:hypothetical protein